MSHVIVKDGLAVRIPQRPSIYRSNCHKDYGCFVHGETKNKSSRQIEKEGLLKGEFVEMALVYIDQKILTFKPHYTNEHFTEIWGIPVAGEMKTQFPDNASELSAFLIHRQSKDKLAQVIEGFSKEAFTQWVNEGMKNDYQEYAIEKATEYYFGSIFRFEFEGAMSPEHGAYYYVKSSFRKAETEIEKTACAIAKEIYTGYKEYCSNEQWVLNHQQCTKLLAESKSDEVNHEVNENEVNKNGKKKILASK